MSDHLRVQLARTQIEQLRREDENRDVWGSKFAQARAAWAAGIRRQEPRFPIIIASDSPISSPEKLQAIAGLPSVPEVTRTTEVEMFSDDEVESADGNKVQVCDVDWNQMEKIKATTEWEETLVLFNGQKRFAVLVEHESAGVSGVTQLLRAIGGWGTPSGRGLHMFRSMIVASSTAAVLGLSLAATLGLLTGSGSVGFAVGSCVGFVGASIAYHRVSLSQAIIAMRENPRLMQLHLSYNFPLQGFRYMRQSQLDEMYWRESLHRQMLLISAWQSASSYLDEIHETRTRREIDRLVLGESRGLVLGEGDETDEK
ncbi:hypothetical protein SCARD494_05580 [Seiridium cardinale]